MAGIMTRDFDMDRFYEGGDYLVFDAWSGNTLGYVRNCAHRGVAAEKAWAKWGGLARVTPGDPPFDWRDKQIEVID